MTERTIEAADLARLRFAVSPMWECVASIRVLQHSRAGGLHEPWASLARRRVADAGLDLSLLSALIPPQRHLADFVTPTPGTRRTSIEDACEAIAATDEAQVLADLHDLLAQSPTPQARVLLTEGLRDLRAVRERTAADLRAYWEVALAPYADRLRGLAESDIAWRLDQIAAGGTHQVLSSLHPSVRIEAERLVIEKACRAGAVAPGLGLVLVPCAFAFPDLLFLDMPGHAPTLSYSPRGVGNLWRATPDPTGSALAALMGTTRAATLLLLDLPMTTTQLACHLDVSAPTMSEHLRVLARTGLVSATRRGREVLYARTTVSEELIAAGEPV